MIDETYVEFVEDMDKITAMPLTESFDNLIVLRGVSKFFAAPGLRFGYGVTGNSGLLSQLNSIKNPWSLNSIGAYAGELLLSDKNYIQNHVRLFLLKESVSANGFAPFLLYRCTNLLQILFY